MNKVAQNTAESLYKKVTIESIREEVPGFKTFILSTDPENMISYKAGQYLTLVHPSPQEEVRRSYSIISVPELGEPLTIGVKRIENGFFSRRLVEQAQPGDQLMTIGAAGRFVLPDQMQDIQQVFFLAAGSGITPIFALIKSILHRYPHIKVVLVYSNAAPEKTVFRQELENLQTQHPQQFYIEFLYSNSQHLSRARLYRDLLESFLKSFITVPFGQALFYICGPEAYMRMCSYVLQEAQVPADHIKKENFIIERIKPPKAVPPDIEAHKVNLILYGQPYQLVAQYPDTILAAAKKGGLTLPYSCEMGRCGNCLARCTSGHVWHAYNEVLTDAELQQGMVLTCTGYPVGGDINLEIK